MKTLAQQRVSVGALSFSTDGALLLASCSYRCADNPGQVVWEVASSNPLVTYRQHDDSVRATAVSPDGRWAASAGGSNNESTSGT